MHRLLAVFYLFHILSFSHFAQDETAIKPFINPGDLKQLLKADKFKNNGDKLTEEAIRLNMEALKVQNEMNLNEEKIRKKAEKLENLAQQKQIQASSFMEKCSELKFKIYKRYLDDFWNTHSGEESDYINAKLLEETANDIYSQSKNLRVLATKTKEGREKIEILAKANNLEEEAIQKQLAAFGIYRGIDSGIAEIRENGYKPVAIPLENKLPEKIVVNQSMIDRYNAYIASGQFIDTSLSTGQISGITSFDGDLLLQLWYQYLYGENSTAVETAMPASNENEMIPAKDQYVDNPRSPDAGEREIGIITDQNRDVLVPAYEDVIYRVQLSANRAELTQRALSKMYYGKKTIEMISQDGWYKYSVGDFSTYEEANRFRLSSGISNAFVIGYRKGTRFISVDSVSTKDPIKTVAEQTMHGLPPGLIFRVQIAASRVPVAAGQLNSIHAGRYPVEMVFEDGWYKYQLMGVRQYADALRIVRNIGSEGAFIVSYQNGLKTMLAESIKKNRESGNFDQPSGSRVQPDDIEYHVQLAASRTAMKPEEVESLCNNPEMISIVFEEGWFKYHLKAGNSPDLAQQLLKECGIEKAFIVPYRRAAKITLYEATHEIE